MNKLLTLFLVVGFSYVQPSLAETRTQPKKGVMPAKTAPAKIAKKAVRDNLTRLSQADADKILSYGFFSKLSANKASQYLDLMKVYAASLEAEMPPPQNSVSIYDKLAPLQFVFSKFFERACAEGEGAAPGTVKPYVCAGFLFSGGLSADASGKPKDIQPRKCIRRLASLRGDNKLDVKGFIDPDKTSCEDGQVVCNPLVFCYDIDESAVLCVDDKPSNDISRRCMALSREKAKIPGSQKKDPNEKVSVDANGNVVVDDYRENVNGGKKILRTDEESMKIAEASCQKVGGVAEHYNTGFWRGVRGIGKVIGASDENMKYQCKKTEYANKCTALAKQNPEALKNLQKSFNDNCVKKTQNYQTASKDFQETCSVVGQALAAFVDYTEQENTLDQSVREETDQ